jgi:hypothetical protein
MIASAAADQGGDTKNSEPDPSADNIYTLNDFEVRAKGPACAFALAFSSGLPSLSVEGLWDGVYVFPGRAAGSLVSGRTEHDMGRAGSSDWACVWHNSQEFKN